MKRTVIGGRLALLAAVVAGATGAAVVAPAAAFAQSVPGAIAKQAARNAVAATNRHTEAMTNTGSTTPTTIPGQDAQARPTLPPPRPEDSRPARSQAAPAPSRAVRTTAAPTPAAPTATAPAATAPAAKPAPVQASKGAPTPGAPTPGAAATTAASTPAAPSKPATPGAPAGGAQAAQAAPAPRYAATSGKGQGTASVSVSESGATTQMGFARETFEYAGRGRRDPFVSLMASGDLRPLYQDLSLVAVLYDPTGRNSVAIMRDISTKDQYRVKVGQTLGRMRVSQIQPKQVVFALEEFGYSRQEVLALNDSTHARKK